MIDFLFAFVVTGGPIVITLLAVSLAEGLDSAHTHRLLRRIGWPAGCGQTVRYSSLYFTLHPYCSDILGTDTFTHHPDDSVPEVPDDIQ